MSQQLSLVDYNSDADGRFHEPEKSVILSIFITNEFVDYFNNCGLFEKFKLYEDSDFNSFIELTRLKEDMTDIAIKKIESRFIQLLESEQVESIKKIQSDDEIANLIGEFKVISDIYHLIKLKRDNFAHIATSIIKLG